jgi:NADH:ubiquinone oxidoreductase subunit 5 (subunit L)/multisubunit Na+/H+ antiporter MnhA subunit
MYLTLVFLPLLGSISTGFFSRKIGAQGASIISVSCLFFTCFLSFCAFYEVALAGSPVYINLMP